MRFDRPGDPSPLPVELAVSRGLLLVNGPVGVLLVAGFGSAYFLLGHSAWVACAVAILGFASAWLWWSYFIPEWRSWAIGKGADSEELQALGVQSGLVWPRGSFFERTEFRRNGR